ncbi:uncharacterized protein LOC111333375 [Stylophora pistillata]|uniref:uncharacterized protein LOC111333375 n=1 Tax=Stylophora pistillata TaxID=50429 RepID=UPI000C03CE12|nr:uncharacterized protein LOC111333375 [Stylophora pistillata]
MSNCYWHQKLTKESSFLCVFSSPFGRFRFKRMPFVISCASEVAQKMVDKHFGDISGALPIFDDIIIEGRDEQEHDMILRKMLTRAIRLNGKASSDIIRCLSEIFSRHGSPQTLIAENFPYNSREIKEYATQYGINIIKTSPTYSQENGLAEKVVNIVKNLLRRSAI